MRRFAIIGLIAVAFGGTVWFATSKRHNKAITETPVARPSMPSDIHASPTSVPLGRNQIDVNALTPQQVRAEVMRRDAEDSKWEWKTPIRFYGKVIDEQSRPIPAADVHFQWTNLSAKGTEEIDARTDEQGLFSLNDVQGKRLLVRITKPGYYSSGGRNRLSFEFASPFEEIYHQPKADTPILFHLRRRGPPADLLIRSAEIMLPGDGTPTGVQLETGNAASNGELQVQAWKPWPPKPMSPPYDWKVVFTLHGGGFTEAPDELAFEAPENGYNEQYTVDMPADLGTGWKVSTERTLYFSFGEPKKYGRIVFRTDANSRYIFLDYFINRSGSRQLEDSGLR